MRRRWSPGWFQTWFLRNPKKTKFSKKCLKLFRIKNELEQFFFFIFDRHWIFENSKNKFTNLLRGFLPLKIKISLKLFFRRIRNKILIWRMKFQKKNSKIPCRQRMKKNRFHFWFQTTLVKIFQEFWFSDFLGKKSEISHLRFFECNYEMVRRRRLLTSISLRKSYLVPRSFDLILKSVASDCDVISRKTIKSSVRLSSGLSV